MAPTRTPDDIAKKIRSITVLGEKLRKEHIIAHPEEAQRYYDHGNQNEEGERVRLSFVRQFLSDLTYVTTRHEDEVLAIGAFHSPEDVVLIATSSADTSPKYIPENWNLGEIMVAENTPNPVTKSDANFTFHQFQNLSFPLFQGGIDISDWVSKNGRWSQDSAIPCHEYVDLFLTALKITSKEKTQSRIFRNFARAMSISKAHAVLRDTDYRSVHRQEHISKQRREGNGAGHINVRKYIQAAHDRDSRVRTVDKDTLRYLKDFWVGAKAIYTMANEALSNTGIDTGKFSFQDPPKICPESHFDIAKDIILFLHWALSTTTYCVYCCVYPLGSQRPIGKKSTSAIPKLGTEYIDEIMQYQGFAASRLCDLMMNSKLKPLILEVCTIAVRLEADPNFENIGDTDPSLEDNQNGDDDEDYDLDVVSEYDNPAECMSGRNWLYNYLVRLIRFDRCLKWLFNQTKSLSTFNIKVRDVTEQNPPSSEIAPLFDTIEGLYQYQKRTGSLPKFPMPLAEFVDRLQADWKIGIQKEDGGNNLKSRWESTFNGTYHCESIVAADMATSLNSLPKSSRQGIISVSKLCCIACDAFIRATLKDNVLWPGTSNAITKWALPPNSSIMVAEAVEEALQKAVFPFAVQKCKELHKKFSRRDSIGSNFSFGGRSPHDEEYTNEEIFTTMLALSQSRNPGRQNNGAGEAGAGETLIY